MRGPCAMAQFANVSCRLWLHILKNESYPSCAKIRRFKLAAAKPEIAYLVQRGICSQSIAFYTWSGSLMVLCNRVGDYRTLNVLTKPDNYPIRYTLRARFISLGPQAKA